jgi:hypothetical protein
MKIHDRIYGEFEIASPLIEELIASRPFQRLRRINQYGGVDLVFPGKYQVTRYEHSLGVWKVLESLQASIEVQAAALLHDLGHTAFSHMVDMALASSGEDYHEEKVALIEGMGDIERILKAHGVAIQNPDDYPEIKRSLPDVGADRIDYGVRDFVGATNTRPELGRRVLGAIAGEGREIIFTDAAVARDYALTGLEAMWLCIYEPKVSCVYQALTEIIREGVKGRWLTDRDLFTDDATVFAIIKRHRDELPETHYKLFTTPFTVQEVAEGEHDFNHIKLKVRYFDPRVRIGGETRPLSEVDKEFREKLEPMKRQFEERKKGKFFKVVFKQ